MKDEYKEGEYIVITKSNNNWTRGMDHMAGKIVQLNRSCNGESVSFKDSGGFTWNASQGHFRKALFHEIPGAVPSIINSYEIY